MAATGGNAARGAQVTPMSHIVPSPKAGQAEAHRADGTGAGAWTRLRQAQHVAVTATAVTRDAQELGSSQVLTLEQIEQASIHGTHLSGVGCVILPTNPLKQAWDMVVLVVLGFSAIIVPFRVAFYSEQEELQAFTPWSITELVMDFLLLLDVLLTFFSAIEVDGIVDVNLRSISWRYLTSWFVFDLAASLPLSLVVPTVGQGLRGVRLLRLPRMLKLLKVFRLLRVMRVLRASRYARSIQRYVNLNPAVLRLLTFIAAFMLFSHVAACLWFLVADLEEFLPDTWVARYGILDSPLAEQYVASLYYSTTLLSTTGLGDIVPLLPSEQIYTIFLEVAGITVISYLTSTITGLIGSFDARARRRRLKFEEVERFMGAKNLTPQLRSLIRDYFEMVLASKSTAALDESKLLSELSGPLQTAVVFEVHGSLIERFGFFKGKQAEFVRDTLKAASPLQAPHDRLIVREGMAGDALYLLIEGRVNFEALDGTVYMQLPAGSVFGAMALLCTGRNVCSTRAVGFVQLYSISRRDVERVLEDYPDVEAELLTLALARLKRIETGRNRMRAARKDAARGRFSEAAEAATDLAVSRALAQPGTLPSSPSAAFSNTAAGLARRQVSSTKPTPRRAQDDGGEGLAAGSAQRVAMLRHMAETRHHRRASTGSRAAHDERSPSGPPSSGHLRGRFFGEPEDGSGPPVFVSGAGRPKGEADSKSAASRAVDLAMAGGAGVTSSQSAQGNAPSSPGQQEPQKTRGRSLTAGSAGAGPSSALGLRSATNGSAAETESEVAPVAGTPTPSASEGGPGDGPPTDGAEAGRPDARQKRASEVWPLAMPPLLDASSRKRDLHKKSESAESSAWVARASRRRSATTVADRAQHGFEEQLTQSKELEVSRQTDSLIDRTMTTVDRAVRRKERLVSRMAAERERRQFTSKPLRSREAGTPGHASPERPPADQEPSAAMSMSFRSNTSKRLQERARGLRAKLDAQRKQLHEVTAFGASGVWATGGDDPAAIVPHSHPGAGAAGEEELTPTAAAARVVSTRGLLTPGRAPSLSGPSLTAAIQDMTVAMRAVASSIAGLQLEQEAIVDLLIEVLADDLHDNSDRGGGSIHFR